MEKEAIKFEAPEKPKIEDLKEIIPDTEDFNNSEKAEALIKSLSLSIGDNIKEVGEENFIINPKMVLSGTSPREYKSLIEDVKNVLTKKEIYSINRYIKANKENSKRRNAIYNAIDKRVNQFYENGEVKENIKDTNVKNSLISLKLKTHGFSNTIYHLLSKDKQDYLICYKNAWLNLPIPNQQEWREENDGEYMVLTESDADYQAKEYLTDDNYLWKCAIETGNTTESLEDWAESVLSMDGRGSVLNGYDGVEEQEEINGIWYCIYRTN